MIGPCKKLPQATAGRAKPPNRRPPSTLFLKENVRKINFKMNILQYTYHRQIPELKDLEVVTDEEEEEEEEEKIKAKAGREEAESGRPAGQFKGQSMMKMLDISSVKLRETKPTLESRPKTEGEKKSAVPSWMEELSKKQARRSAGVFPEQDFRVKPLVPPKSPVISK